VALEINFRATSTVTAAFFALSPFTARKKRAGAHGAILRGAAAPMTAGAFLTVGSTTPAQEPSGSLVPPRIGVAGCLEQTAKVRQRLVVRNTSQGRRHQCRYALVLAWA
jgi:hypothetical protein